MFEEQSQPQKHPLRVGVLAVRWRQSHYLGRKRPANHTIPVKLERELGETVIPIDLEGLAGTGLMATMTEGAPKGFMDALPDPMKLDPYQIGFVIVLMTVLYLFLKFTFFKPVTQVMDEREAAIAAGGAAKTEAALQVEQRQAEYATRLRELRGKAFEHRKTLAAAAALEKTALIEKARQQASDSRSTALEELRAAKDAAKLDLVAQVDALSESMVQHLLKQA